MAHINGLVAAQIEGEEVWDFVIGNGRVITRESLIAAQREDFQKLLADLVKKEKDGLFAETGVTVLESRSHFTSQKSCSIKTSVASFVLNLLWQNCRSLFCL